jgi:TonB-linked SusC/RagA family outer membrane protein
MAVAATLLLVATGFPLLAQSPREVKGAVLDAQKNPIVGASVQVKTTNVTASTGEGGRFSIMVPAGKNILVISFVGKASQEINISGKSITTVTLTDTTGVLDDVIVVGYGKQKKESLVGSIAQVNGKVLERTGGVSNLGMALTGNLPGLVTTASSGMPGGEDPQILIRAQTTWNGGGPLILVDGIERPGSIGSLDMSSIESVSILKDASATAVFGVKGANGVILITTKKGVEGKASLRIRSNMTVKVASKLPAKYDSYDALMLRNTVLERDLVANPNGWGSIRPVAIIDKYRNPTSTEDWDRYPNVDWAEELFKKSTNSYNTSASVSGGSKFVTYFASVDFTSEGDLFKKFENGRGYTAGYGFNRTNLRSNLDFNLTKTTKLTTRLYGSNGVRELPGAAGTGDGGYWTAAYRSAPDGVRPIYSDGTWGYYNPRNADLPNGVYDLANSGTQKRTTTQITTDFVLVQELDMILKGLSMRGSLSMDNTFRENNRGINDLYNGPQRKWIDPETGEVKYETPLNTGTQLDYMDPVRWTVQAGEVDRGATYRKLNYIAQINYARQFGQHNVTALGLLQREKYATGSEFFRFREDWVFRATYNYAFKYFFEANGAYNGTEKYGPDYRFAFFPSFSGGWTISNEKFIKDNFRFLDQLKVRGSWGRVGDDNGGGRFAYSDQWAFGGNLQLGSPISNTSFPFYRITLLGNPNLSWESVEKRNIGVDFSIFRGKISGSVDVFKDQRSNIVIGGGDRAIPTYFGVPAPSANLGKASGKGYELALNLNHTFRNGLKVWANTNMTHAENKVINRDDPQLLPDYQKQAGWQLGQTRTYLDQGFLQSRDDIYGSTQTGSNNQLKLVGDYNIIDYNGDGIIDNYDQVPYQYSGSPQNTYNATVGVDWKGLSFFVQFYGVNNVSRWVSFPTFNTYPNSNAAYVEGSYWLKENGGGEVPLPRWGTNAPQGADGTRYLFDGSYMRLKNAEIGYNISGKGISKLGLKSCRVYVNGNNLLLWTDMPDDRESNFATGGGSSSGAYPTMRRFNIGIDVNL